jgi:hypothetical protein
LAGRGRGRLESFIGDIAVEVVTSAEISYREGCVREFEWRVRRKTELEEEARQRQLELERNERLRLRQIEQARIDRLIEERTGYVSFRNRTVREFQKFP